MKKAILTAAGAYRLEYGSKGQMVNYEIDPIGEEFGVYWVLDENGENAGSLSLDRGRDSGLVSMNTFSAYKREAIAMRILALSLFLLGLILLFALPDFTARPIIMFALGLASGNLYVWSTGLTNRRLSNLN